MASELALVQREVPMAGNGSKSPFGQACAEGHRLGDRATDIVVKHSFIYDVRPQTASERRARSQPVVPPQLEPLCVQCDRSVCRHGNKCRARKTCSFCHCKCRNKKAVQEEAAISTEHYFKKFGVTKEMVKRFRYQLTSDEFDLVLARGLAVPEELLPYADETKAEIASKMQQLGAKIRYLVEHVHQEEPQPRCRLASKVAAAPVYELVEKSKAPRWADLVDSDCE